MTGILPALWIIRILDLEEENLVLILDAKEALSGHTRS